MRKTGLTDDALCQAVSEMTEGLIDAHLGSSLVKKRIALHGRGKRVGSRTIVATNMTDRWCFLYGFTKNEQDNIDTDELKALQELASEYMALSGEQLAYAINNGKIFEIYHGNHKA